MGRRGDGEGVELDKGSAGSGESSGLAEPPRPEAGASAVTSDAEVWRDISEGHPKLAVGYLEGVVRLEADLRAAKLSVGELEERSALQRESLTEARRKMAEQRAETLEFQRRALSAEERLVTTEGEIAASKAKLVEALRPIEAALPQGSVEYMSLPVGVVRNLIEAASTLASDTNSNTEKKENTCPNSSSTDESKSQSFDPTSKESNSTESALPKSTETPGHQSSETWSRETPKTTPTSGSSHGSTSKTTSSPSEAIGNGGSGSVDAATREDAREAAQGASFWSSTQPEPPPYSIGSAHWPGLGKLIEEAGEALQVIGKLIGTGGSAKHWDGSNLRQRLWEEIADLLAGTRFVIEANGLSDKWLGKREAEKLAQFRQWHQDPVAPPAAAESDGDR